MRTIKNCLPVLLLLLTLGSAAQEQTTVFKADSWLDLKKYVSAVRAMKAPVKENAKVTQTEKSFKVMLGKTTYTYLIDSVSRFSEEQTRYHVNRNGKYYLLSITKFNDGVFGIAADDEKHAGEWMLYPASQVTTTAQPKPGGAGQ